MKLSPFYSDVVPIINTNAMRTYYGKKNIFTSCCTEYSHYLTTKNLLVEIVLVDKTYMFIKIFVGYNIWHVYKYNKLTEKIFLHDGFITEYCCLSQKICNIIRKNDFSSIYKNKLYKNYINYKLLIQNLVNFF